MKQKFSEAIRQMKPGDKFETNESVNIICVVGDDPPDAFLFEWDSDDSTNLEGYIRMTSCIMGYEGEIIRAEPEALTAEQMAREYNSRKIITTTDEFAEQCIKNGQTKEWKRLKPLIDAAKIIGNDQISDSELNLILKNLTPPWETE